MNVPFRSSPVNKQELSLAMEKQFWVGYESLQNQNYSMAYRCFYPLEGNNPPVAFFYNWALLHMRGENYQVAEDALKQGYQKLQKENGTLKQKQYPSVHYVLLHQDAEHNFHRQPMPLYLEQADDEGVRIQFLRLLADVYLQTEQWEAFSKIADSLSSYNFANIKEGNALLQRKKEK